MDDPHAKRPGLKEFRSSQGHAVNYKEGNEFEILHPSGIIAVTTDDSEFN